MSWQTSNRRARLPANWDTLVAQVKRRAKGRCEAKGQHAQGCTGTGTECDHIEQGDDHSLANLQWLSGPCHARKTRLDNGLTMRPTLHTEQHPGRIN